MFGELLGFLGVLVGEVCGFPGVGDQVVQLGSAAIIIAEQFPLAVTHGEVWQVVEAVIIFPVWRAAEVEGCLA